MWVADETGATRVFETPTTKDVQSGVLDAVTLAAEGFGLTIEQFCAQIECFGHGTTVGLNALLTGTGAKTGILTTRGFADTLEIGRLTRQSTGLDEHEYRDSFLRNRFPPLVPRNLIIEIDERIDVNGRVITPLDEGQARSTIRALAKRGTEAVTVCTLFATVDPVHERRLREIVNEEVSHAFVSVARRHHHYRRAGHARRDQHGHDADRDIDGRTHRLHQRHLATHRPRQGRRVSRHEG